MTEREEERGASITVQPNGGVDGWLARSCGAIKEKAYTVVV